jgi:hypothetical protein
MLKPLAFTKKRELMMIENHGKELTPNVILIVY